MTLTLLMQSLINFSLAERRYRELSVKIFPKFLKRFIYRQIHIG